MMIIMYVVSLAAVFQIGNCVVLKFNACVNC